jgi:hypothetical protein
MWYAESAYQGCISFDWCAAGEPGAPIIDGAYDVILIGAGLAIYMDTSPASETWSTQTVLLEAEAGWQKCTGGTLTEIEMRAVLASLDFLLIRGDHISVSADSGAMDNIILMLAVCPTQYSSWGRIKSLYH